MLYNEVYGLFIESLPNSNVSIIDAGFPGTLPVLNGFCVEQAVKSGLGINAKINLFSAFDRKNYFYPDLPKGYQISQFYHPIAECCWLEILNDDDKRKRINITRLHLEQDAGKSMHDQVPGYTCIDLNRAGVPLMEIVSEPEISSPFEAGEYLKQLRSILRYAGTCSGDMENGAFRCDANVSVRRKNEKSLGTRCEIKNLNSIKHVMKAIEFEGNRQVQSLERGQAIKQHTMLFSPDSGETRPMRSKEDSQDYRYFPDPDLAPVIITQEYVDAISLQMPEMPEAKIARYVESFLISEIDARTLTTNKDVASYFEAVVLNGSEPKIAANWIISVIFSLLRDFNCNILECRISPADLARLIFLVTTEKISGKSGKIVCEEIFKSGGKVDALVLEMNLEQLTDENQIKAMIERVLQLEEETVIAYRNGKHKVFNFLVASVIKHSSGRASPSIVQNLLSQMLDRQDKSPV